MLSGALILILTTAFIAACAGIALAELSTSQKAEIDEIAQQMIAAANYPSTVILVDQGGQTIYSGNFGTANLEHELLPTPDTPYAIGSITKSFTALAVLLLAESGKVNLDAPLSDYLVDFQGPAKSVPVRRLLDHTNGIPNYTDNRELRPRLERDAFSREEMVDTFESLPLLFQPGEKFHYTNSGYYLLGLIIEAVSGQSYYEFLQQNVFDPLGMSQTSSGDSSELVLNRAGGYDLSDSGFVNAPPWSHLVPYSAGSLVSTANDLVRYRRGVFHSEEFSPTLKDMLVTTQPMSDGTDNIYALGGLVVGEFEGHRKYAHAGDIWGFASNHAYYPDEDLTIVILTNRQAEAPSTSSFEQKIARVVFDIPQPEIRDLPLSDAAAERYAGDYDLHPFVFGPPRYGFVAKDGKLHLSFGGTEAGGPLIPLLSQGDNRFRAPFDDEWLFEFRFDDADGKASGFESHYRDGIFHAFRAD